jgi:predicted AAA+ superfamily ATPase
MVSSAPMEGRASDLADLRRLLRDYPAVAIIGPRQVGKTTLASAVADAWDGDTERFDLERAADLGRLADPSTALEPLRGLVVLDEIQRRPDLFPTLRVLADRRPRRARFLILGSASPTLLRQSSESLAGRIAYRELDGFGLEDVGVGKWRRLWLRGGFPASFLARTDAASFELREQLIATYLRRDLPDLGIRLEASTLERFWTMLAHYHGQTWNSSELARSFGVSDQTVRRWLDILQDTFMVRILRPWSDNVGKRVVKSPKVYVRDAGLLHTLFRVADSRALLHHPKLGASFEGFALGEVVRRLRASWRDCYFWATHQGAELDLLVVNGNRRHGFEFKHTIAPEVTKSMKIAVADLKLSSLDILHIGKETYPLTKQIRAVAFERLHLDVQPLR